MKKPVSIFIYKVLLFVVPVLVVFEILFRLGCYPVITDSTFFDLKMMGIQKHPIKNVQLLAIGSSVALNDLNSEIIVQNLNMPYYNFASWALQMADTENLLKGFVKKYNPKYVILCSSLGDFKKKQNDTYLNYLNESDYIRDNFPEFFYFKSYSSVYRIIRRKYKSFPLNLDKWGAVSLQEKQKNTNNTTEDEWNKHQVFPTAYTLYNYQKLDTLSAFLKQQNVKLIFIQVPIEKSYAGTAANKQKMESHFSQCRSIVEKHGGIYLNYYNTTIFADSLFRDQIHLQGMGATVLTKEIVADLKKIIH